MHLPDASPAPALGKSISTTMTLREGSNRQDVLGRFVPAHLARLLAQDPDAPRVSSMEIPSAALMFADIKGYTALTESYSELGPDGIEQLRTILNQFFGQIESVIEAWGGDIVSFIGDSALVLWSASEERSAETTQHLAVCCACDLQRAIDQAGRIHDTPFRMRVALVAGMVHLVTVGGIDRRWQCVVTGPPLADITTLISLADPGDVIMSRSMRDQLADRVVCEPAGSMAGRVKDVSWPSTPAAAKVPPTACTAAYLSAALSHFVPLPVLQQIDAGLFDWLSEYRRMTVLFASLGGLAVGDSQSLGRHQSSTLLLQKAISDYEGTLLRSIVDDKGPNVMAAWGLPGRQNELDPARAVSAAQLIQSEFSHLGIVSSIGISTGRVFCGIEGGVSRFEYSLSGAPANLAARLMQAANGGILCDEATRIGCRQQIDFEHLTPLHVKGREAPIAVYRPAGPGERAGADDGSVPSRDQLNDGRLLVDRGGDLHALIRPLVSLGADESGLAIVSGEPGIGKSTLIDVFLRKAKARNIACYVGRGDGVERNTPYLAWRALISQILEEQTQRQSMSRQEWLNSICAENVRLSSHLWLLNDILPLGLAGDRAAAPASDEARAEAVIELVIHVVACSMQAGRTLLLVFDDAQWIDSMSWKLAAAVTDRIRPSFLVVVTRSDESIQLLNQELALRPRSISHVDLGPFDRRQIETLLAARLTVKVVDSAIISFVLRKSGGNPLFCEQLILAMQDSRLLQIHEGECTLSGSDDALEVLKLPDTVEGLIASRVDGLPTPLQLTIKVASVVGDDVPLRLLAAIHPQGASESELLEQLHVFSSMGLTSLDRNGTAWRCSFAHAIARSVTYELLPFSHRRRLHREIATWIERWSPSEIEQSPGRLAHHWLNTETPAAAIPYLNLAGEQALSRYANSEAAHFLGKAVDQMDRSPRHGTKDTRMRSERLLGYANLLLGKLEESKGHLLNSLALSGIPVPRSNWLRVLGAAGNATTAGLRGTFTRRSALSNLSAQQREEAVALMRLSHIGYFLEDSTLMLFASMRCLKLVSGSEDCRETAIVFAAIAAGAGLIPLRSTAVRLGERAIAIAETQGDAHVTAQVLLFVTLYGVGIGDWSQCTERIRRAEELSRAAGDSRRREECIVVDGYINFFTGRFDAASSRYETLVELGRRRGDQQTTAWGLLGMARVHLRLGNMDAAEGVLHQAAELVSDRLSSIELFGMQAMLCLRQREIDGCLRATTQGLRLLVASRPSSFSTLIGTTSLAEALVALSYLARTRAIQYDADRLETDARKSLSALRVFARIFPIGKTAYLHQRGSYLLAAGRRERALLEYRQCLAAAKALRMPVDEALAALEIAALAGEREASASRKHAESICSTVGLPMQRQGAAALLGL